MIGESIAYAATRKDEVLFDAEHFFDGYKANPDYALACVKAAYENGARWVVLCDTNGGMLPMMCAELCPKFWSTSPATDWASHTHDDTGNAVVIRAGSSRDRRASCPGLAERVWVSAAASTNLITLIPNLMLKYDGAYETGIDDDGMRKLTRVSRLLDELLNRTPDRHAAYVGEGAFTHKGGLHVSAVQKDPATYEHVDPERVGNHRHIVVSDQAGRSNILSRLSDAGIDMEAKDPRISRLVEDVKARASSRATPMTGRKRASNFSPGALWARCQPSTRWKASAPGRAPLQRPRRVTTISQAVVKMEIDGAPTMQVAEGNGPVNALDDAMRKALLPKYPVLETMRLVDFKVQILTPQQATAAVTRVMIRSADETGIAGAPWEFPPISSMPPTTPWTTRSSTSCCGRAARFSLVCNCEEGPRQSRWRYPFTPN